jgi:hypothetical protein
VRDIYPGALTATADVDDMRAIATLQSKANALQPPAEKAAGSPPPIAAKPALAASTAAAVPTAAAARTVPPTPMASAVPTAASTPTVSVKPAIAATPVSAKPPPSVMPAVEMKNPLPVAAAVPTLSAPVPVLMPRQTDQPVKRPPGLETAPTTSAKPTTSPQPVQSTRPALSPQPVQSTRPAISPKPTLSPKPASAMSIPSEQLSKHVPSLETTQTVRALTQLELEDDQVSRWFVIQLSLAEEPFDPDTVPNLDIFSVYRLYSVAGIDQGRIVHALRLGFFTEEIAAGAVASYLAAFYDKPSINRVSAAERERFAEQSLEPRKDVGATGKHAAIEITSERFVREKRSGQTAAK